MKETDMLKRTDVKTALDEALSGSRKLKLTFNKGACEDIFYLLGMRGKIILLEDIDYVNLYCVASTRRWERVSRDVTISLQPDFSEEHADWFLGRMNERVLEAVAVA